MIVKHCKGKTYQPFVGGDTLLVAFLGIALSLFSLVLKNHMLPALGAAFCIFSFSTRTFRTNISAIVFNVRKLSRLSY